MQITLSSFVTAVLLSSLLIVALYGSRKSAKTIWMLNFGNLAWDGWFSLWSCHLQWSSLRRP